jgi:hypothetical protein
MRPLVRDALTQEVDNQRAPLVRNDGMVSAGAKLALTHFTLMILFTRADMAVFLGPL